MNSGKGPQVTESGIKKLSEYKDLGRIFEKELIEATWKRLYGLWETALARNSGK